MTYRYPRSLFSAVGVELEYMVVDRDTLDVRPIVDAFFKSMTGAYASDVEPAPGDGVGWCNELALHVLEIKTLDPVASLDGVAARMQSHVKRANELLGAFNARLMPGAMHPWMDPHAEMRLWPHEYNAVYEAFHRIFNCTGHGWANLQSTHVNLPFADDEEFGRLHAAIRLVLPLIPALAASSPVADGALQPVADRRLDVYRTNSKRVPQVAGRVIPERAFTRATYERDILGSIYDALSPHDPEGILRYEWANARGCIARFDRGAIEIRLIDIQECPKADMAIVALIVAAVRALVDERWMSQAEQRVVDVDPLHAALLSCIERAERTVITEPRLLEAFGVEASEIAAGDLWAHLADALLPSGSEHRDALRRIHASGTLSSRLRRATETDGMRETWSRLCGCLEMGEMFEG